MIDCWLCCRLTSVGVQLPWATLLGLRGHGSSSRYFMAWRGWGWRRGWLPCVWAGVWGSPCVFRGHEHFPDTFQVGRRKHQEHPSILGGSCQVIVDGTTYRITPSIVNICIWCDFHVFGFTNLGYIHNSFNHIIQLCQNNESNKKLQIKYNKSRSFFESRRKSGRPARSLNQTQHLL